MRKNLQMCIFFCTFVSQTRIMRSEPNNLINLKYNESIRINRQDLR